MCVYVVFFRNRTKCKYNKDTEIFFDYPDRILFMRCDYEIRPNFRKTVRYGVAPTLLANPSKTDTAQPVRR